MSGATLFRAVDLAIFVAALTDKLRTAGLNVGLASEEACARALQACPPTDVQTAYWVTRCSLVHSHEDFAAFDMVFAAIFENAGLPIAPWERQAPKGTIKMTGTMVKHSAPTDGFALASQRMQLGEAPEVEGEYETEDPNEPETMLPELVPSHLMELADTPFDELSQADLDVIGEWLQHAFSDFPTRLGRRWKRRRRGVAIDLRQTLRTALRTGAEPVVLARRARKPRPRRLVMVADVSGSMEAFARVYLHLMRSLVTYDHAEVFTFATTLKRVTVPLRDRNADAAIDQMSDEVEDRFSGTRIAASLGELIGSPVWSNAVRGATVIIASDGWDTDQPEELARHMARLNRLAYRIIWINPRVAAVHYAPETSGMAAALPFVDTFLSGHSLRHMEQVITAIAR